MHSMGVSIFLVWVRVFLSWVLFFDFVYLVDIDILLYVVVNDNG
jgi:hypothetical protein